MLKFLYQLDDLDNIQANLAAEAANRLDVGEFQLFQLAYRAWYGVEADPKVLEQEFLEYMLHDQVPPWVRQFARNIIKSDDSGRLDPEAEEFHQYDRDRPLNSRTWSGYYKVAFVILLTAGFMALMAYNYEPDPSDNSPCYFPPCPWIQ